MTSSIIIYSKKNCPNCDEIIKFLEKEKPIIKKLDVDFTRTWFNNNIRCDYYKSFPVISWKGVLYSKSIFYICYNNPLHPEFTI